eukprot:gene27694-36507_t
MVYIVYPKAKLRLKIEAIPISYSLTQTQRLVSLRRTTICFLALWLRK